MTIGRASSRPVITVVPLAALWLWVSLHLPHRDAPWKALLPGAILVSLGFQVLHVLVGRVPRAEARESTSLYGDLGATTTFLFFMYVCATLVVAAPVINSSLYDEFELTREEGEDAADDQSGEDAL